MKKVIAFIFCTVTLFSGCEKDTPAENNVGIVSEVISESKIV